MGTRNLTMVVLNGKYEVAQYCQWDGYPSGQGVTALSFLNNEYKPELFKDKVSKIKQVTQEQIESFYKEAGHTESGSGWVTMEVSDKFKQLYPYLHRDCGTDVLKIIQDSPDGLLLNREVELAANFSIEWAYVIDLDKETFEVYVGSNEPAKLEDRFYFLVEQQKAEDNPVKLVKSYSLKALPTEEQFLKDLEPQDE